MRNRFHNSYQAQFAKIIGFSSAHPNPLPEGDGDRKNTLSPTNLRSVPGDRPHPLPLSRKQERGEIALTLTPIPFN